MLEVVRQLQMRARSGHGLEIKKPGLNPASNFGTSTGGARCQSPDFQFFADSFALAICSGVIFLSSFSTASLV